MPSKVILVGLDGSEGSRRALGWAVDEARLRHGAVEVVTAWPLRGAGTPPAGTDSAEARRQVDEQQRHLIDSVLRERADVPPVSYELVEGDATEVLLRASGQAELLVIGSHGTSSIRGSMLGSVSEACTQLADCPVVVLPAPAPAPESDLLPASAEEHASVAGRGADDAQ